jgi:arylsulfatase A-like enzyme
MVSDWCYPCTNYYYANSTDERNVTDLKYKVPADDSLFIMDRFENFAYRQAVVNERPFLAYLCLHALHEPHSTLPEFYNMYSIDSEYLGAITQMDNAIGSLISILKKHNIYENTIVIFTSDNGPRQGSERSDVLYSTGHMRQCKKSIFEGGLRVPAIVHAPYLITTNRNITAPVGSVDILPTLIELLQVESDNPTWIMDGISLLPYLVPQHHSNVDYDIRPHEYPLTFWYLETSAIIDNNWKLIYNPEFGTINCAVQPPYDTLNVTNQYLLFDLHSDIHEITDLKNTYPIIFQNLKKKLNDFQISVNYSQHFETRCYLWHNFSHSNL